MKSHTFILAENTVRLIGSDGRIWSMKTGKLLESPSRLKYFLLKLRGVVFWRKWGRAMAEAEEVQEYASNQKPTFAEYKKWLLDQRIVRIAAIDDFEQYQPVLIVRYWRISLNFRFWDPFHLRFTLLTNKRIKARYGNIEKFIIHPGMIDITYGEWRNTKRDKYLKEKYLK